MITNWNDFDSINENLAKARSVLKSLEIPETNEDFLELRKMLSRNAGYLGKFTEWHFNDKIELEQLKNLYTRIRGTRLSKPIDQFKSPEEIIDTIVRSTADAAINQIVGSIPSRARDFLKTSPSCDKCEGEGDIDCDKCEGEGGIDCDKCEGSGEDDKGKECKKCKGESSIECKGCKGEGKVKCKACENGTKEWKEFTQFLALQRDKKDIIIDFFSKKGGRYSEDEYDPDEVLDILKKDIERLINTPSVEVVKDLSINSPKVSYKETIWNSRTRKNEIITKEEVGIHYIYDDDKYLVIASNWRGLQTYGSTYWCITEDEDTFNDYVYSDGICVQLILYIKGKSPLVDDKSVMGITYNVQNQEVTAAHWEDDADAQREAKRIIKSIKLSDIDNLIKSLDIFNYEEEDLNTLLFSYPEKFRSKIEGIIQKSIDESNKPPKRHPRGHRRGESPLGELMKSYFEQIYEYDGDKKRGKLFLGLVKTMLKEKEFKYDTDDLFTTVVNGMINYVNFNTDWLDDDIFDIFEDYGDEATYNDKNIILDSILIFKKNGYKFTNVRNKYLPLLLSTGVVNVGDVYKSINWDQFNKNDVKITKTVYNWVLDNDFDYITTHDTITKLFIDYIISNNLIDKYKSQIIKNLSDINGLEFSIKSTNYILDVVEDDDIDVAAARRLIHKRLHKKYQIDFKKFEGLKGFDEFKI